MFATQLPMPVLSAIWISSSFSELGKEPHDVRDSYRNP